MISIHVITLGKLKESYWKEAEAEYRKRLQPFANMMVHELQEESFSEKDSPAVIKRKEAEKIQEVLKKLKDAYIIALDERGKQCSSKDFAHKIAQLTNQQFNQFVFIIGGPLGLDDSILKQARLKLSLSAMTFTHQMARIILLEQVYRAMTIISGRPYHY